MTGLALLFLVRDTSGSLAAAGLVVGCYTVGTAAGAPLLGRWADRRGATGLLFLSGGVHAAAVMVLVVACWHDVSASAVGPLGFAAGASSPPLDGVLRALWSRLLDVPDDLHLAYTLDTVAVEVVFLVGPALVGVLVGSAGTALPVFAAAALSVCGAGGLAVVSHRVSGHTIGSSAPRRSTRGTTLRPGIVVVLGAGLGFGVCNGLVEVAVAALLSDFVGAVGVVLAAMAAGSVLGGILYSSRTWPGTTPGRFALLQLLFAGGLATGSLVGSAAGLALLLGAAGAFVAPIAAENAVLVGALVAPTRQAEGFGWLLAAVTAGGAAGTALGGVITVHWGGSAALRLASAIMLVCAVASAASTSGLSIDHSGPE